MAAGQMQSSFDVASDDGAHGNTCITIAAFCRSKRPLCQACDIMSVSEGPQSPLNCEEGTGAITRHLSCGSWLIAQNA